MKKLLILLFFPLVSFSQYAPVSVALDSTRLPIVLINTNGQTIEDDPKVTVGFKIVFDENKTWQKPSDSVYNYDGIVGIELRGNSSLYHPKKSFAFETLDAADSTDKSYEILGMPSEEDWILLANYVDPSLMRNEFMHWLWGKTGNYNIKTRNVEVILNGQYIGVYLLTEKIKRDKNRLDLNNLKPDEISGDDLTGGYIVKRDTRDPDEIYYWQSPYFLYYKPFIVVHPKEDDLQPEQYNYIKNYFDSFENALYGTSFTDSLNGYRPFIDEESFVDYFLIQEFSMNVDAYDGSNYYHKDKNGELRVGPVWDFDESLANLNECMSTQNSEGWIHSSFPCISQATIFWWEKLTRDCVYSQLTRQKYGDFREAFLNEEVLFNHIDSTAIVLQDAALRNKQAWEYFGNFQSRVEELKDWISDRLIFMDNHLKEVTRAAPLINAPPSGTAFNSTVSFTSNGCQPGGVLSWHWKTEEFSGKTENSILSVNAQSNMEVFATCNYPYGCEISSADVLNLVLDSDNIGCLNTYIVNNNIQSSIYKLSHKFQSSNTLVAQSNIEENLKVLFQAQNQIQLLPGFNTSENVTFKAQISPCNTN